MRGSTHPVPQGPGQHRPGNREASATERGRSVSDDEVRIGVLVRTIEHEIIPRLMLAHRTAPQCLDLPEASGGITPVDIERFVKLVLSPEDDLAAACVQAMRTAGRTAQDICLGLLAPVARRLGEMWEQDLCDFTDVTFGLGRLHHILRDLGPDFEQAQDAPANGRRILLLPAPGEQHTFGLVMVAEFFRHAGWQVEVGLAGDGDDPLAPVHGEWFDVIGFSAGAEAHVEALRKCVAHVRKVAANPRVCIMVGGNLFLREPGHVQGVGADGVAFDGPSSPTVAEQLVAERAGQGRP